MGADRDGLRRALSVTLVALTFAGLYAYVQAPARAPRGRASTPRPAFDSYHRSANPGEATGSVDPCLSCHGWAPHRRRPGRRAFLNLHVARMECGACHLNATAVTYRRLPEAGGRIAVGRSEAGRWVAATWPEKAGSLRARGPDCTECHRRGSPMLASGLYDAYRQRMLEEPALLYRLREGTL